MTSPASASFPWSQVPEPPSGEFRTGLLPVRSGQSPGEVGTSSSGVGYLAARGARPGPSLLLLVGPEAGFAAVHGLFRLAHVLDARRLAGSLLITVEAGAGSAGQTELLEPASALVIFERLRPNWREFSTAGYVSTGDAAIDQQAEQMAASSGARFHHARPARAPGTDLPGWMAQRQLPAVQLRFPDESEDRPAAVEEVFQGLINILRVLGMLDGQLSPVESRPLLPPAYAEAPVAGFWTPTARPGQRLRIDDRLGSFRDAQGRELGDLLTNISGILLGISDEIWVHPGQPLAELARPAI